MNILLPTDFSDNSRNAAAYALQFFAEKPCVFHLLHVLLQVSGKEGLVPQQTMLEVNKKLKELLVWLNDRKTHPQHQFVVTFQADYFIEVVRKQVLEKSIDLIIMGTKGQTNKKTTIVGKNTSDVMTKVKCPVMAISESTVFRKHKEILFPTDYNIQYNEKMLELLHRLTSMSKAQIKILELFNSKEEPSEAQVENRVFLQNSFGSGMLPHQTFYLSNVTNYANLFRLNKNTDMIVMVAKNLSICQRLLHQPQANQIPFINRLPLLMLH